MLIDVTKGGFFLLLLLGLHIWGLPGTLLADDRMDNLEARVTRLEAIVDSLSIEGRIRIRGNSYNNLDLNKGDRKDNRNDFVDLRSYIILRAGRDNWSGVAGLDLAGDDFNDGVVLGNDDPGKNRQIDVGVRYLYLDYRNHFILRIGRQPARVGHGIASNIIRDMFKVGWDFGRFDIVLVWVKGAEGDSQAGDVPTTRRILGGGTGDDQDLDAFGVVMNTSLSEGGNLQFYLIRKFDTTEEKKHTEHMLAGLSGSGVVLRNLLLKFEFNYLGGRTPKGMEGSPPDRRADIEALMLYLDGTYSYNHLSGGIAFGYGSGDNNPSDGVLRNFQNFFIDETGFHYTYLFSDDIHGYDGRSADTGRGSGFANITWLGFRLGYSIRGLKIGGSYTYLMATRCQKEGSGPLGDGSPLSSSMTRDVGYEMDGDIYYTVNDTVNIGLRGGVFFPGRIYRYRDVASKMELTVEYRF